METHADKEFWQAMFGMIHRNFEYVEWLSGTKADIKDKVDCVVVLKTRTINYQVKTKRYDERIMNETVGGKTVDLNIKQFDRYSQNNYPVDAFGFGINSATTNIAVVVGYRDMCNLWRKQKNVWLKKYKIKDYIKLPIKEIIGKIPHIYKHIPQED